MLAKSMFYFCAMKECVLPQYVYIYALRFFIFCVIYLFLWVIRSENCHLQAPGFHIFIALYPCIGRHLSSEKCDAMHRIQYTLNKHLLS